MSRNLTWRLGSLGATTAFFVLAGCAVEAPTEPSDTALTEPSAAAVSEYPLRRDDPRAQLPRDLLDVPAEQAPERDVATLESTPPSEGTSVRFTVANGQVDTLAAPARSADQDHTPGSYGMLGGDGVTADEIETADEGAIGRVRQSLAAGDTLAWPARAVVKLFITHADGSTGACSGVMVSRRAVLTAGHCVYDRGACNASTGICQPNQGWPKQVRAVPALDGTYMPFGSAKMLVAYTTPEWTSTGTNDYGLVVLDREAGAATGYQSIYAPADGDLTGYAQRTQGYPGGDGTPPGTLQQRFDASGMKLVGATMVRFMATNPNGMSGSGLRSTNHGNYDNYIAGIDVSNELSGGRETGWARAERITYARYTEINGWLNDLSWLPLQGGDYTKWDLRSDAQRTHHSPKVVVRAGTSDRMFLTFRAQDTGATLVRPWTATGGWGALENIGGITTHSPTGVSRMPGFYDAFVRGTNGRIFSKWRGTDGSWGPSQTRWFELPFGSGDTAVAEPAVVSSGTYRLDVFMVGVGGGLYWQFWNGAAWSGWQRIGASSLLYGGVPAAVSRGPGLLDVAVYSTGSFDSRGGYGEASYGTVLSCSGACTSPSDWRPGTTGLPIGAPGARPTAVASSPSRIDYFVRGYDDQVRHVYVDAGVSSEIAYLLGTTGGDVAAVSRAPGLVDIFARSTGGQMLKASLSGSAVWNSWTSLGGDFFGSPAAVSRGSGNLELFGRDTLNRVASRSWKSCSLEVFDCGWTPYPGSFLSF